MTTESAIDAFAASLSKVGSADPRVAAVLLADHLVLAVQAPRGEETSGRSIDPDRAAAAATRGSATDADDVHWRALVHPGAIIWPTAIEVGISRGASGSDIARAAAIGH